MNNIFKKAPVFIIAGALSVSLFSCGGSDEQKKLDEENQAQMDQPPAVQVAPLKKDLFNASLAIPGELIPYQQVDIYAKENSFVKKVFVDVGSEVSQGQLLVSMEAPEINSQLAEAQSKLKSQEAVYLASKANYDRLYETSKTPGTISGNDLDQAAARKNSDEAQLQAAKSALQGILATKGYLDIRAPFSGVISARNVNPGAYVGPSGKGSDQPLFVLQEQKHLRLVVSVPEAYAGVLKEKNKVEFTVRSMPGRKFTATVNRLAGSLDNKLRSERLEMDVMNDNKALLPGMYAEVKLALPGADSTFVIPKTALVQSTEKVFVIKVVGGRAEWVEVQKGREANGKVEVFGKLTSGDQIVQAGNDEIRDGAPVKAGAAKANKAQ
ncbi:efflux transporter periplasmic adaptor subunit [Mucilaginibacter sp. PPCGB 2223]|uniref:efflux RND transporter periplasmic adaptor subunit n=1 Tax=Mucilaginibacter sp. PPCGB 2223 TaxID=1886027 RepID=UPI00082521F8|nr:efflux RND transporter periplasmic adaptor subunit [Mucilaginibacter sp. PPCGB 2223]OCX50404.1 efflux transporter periplasmic adaptor subunit [Mucilaginibacter sp. PPCGB 2223]